VNNALRLLDGLDRLLNGRVDLTLYGRAALALGFPDPPDEYAWSRDIDAVLWLGQAEELDAGTNFWQALEQLNRELADQELYISHLFEEDQVILTPAWRENRVRIPGPWRKLDLHRLGNTDLLLSKLMRDDPIDQADALFIVDRAGFDGAYVKRALRSARVPEVPEIREQFALASLRLLSRIEK